MATKTIVITGASRGIGAAIARAFAAKGWNVVIQGRSTEKGSKFAMRIRKIAKNCEAKRIRIFAISHFFAIFRNFENIFASLRFTQMKIFFASQFFVKKKIHFCFALQSDFERYLEPWTEKLAAVAKECTELGGNVATIGFNQT